MIRWEALSESDALGIWDDSLMGFHDYTLFQTVAWGEHKRDMGWLPCRWVAFNEDNEIMTMVQGLLRKFSYGLGFIWIPGGPVGDISAIGNGFFDFIKCTTGLKRIFCRFYINKRKNYSDMSMLESCGMSRARYRINSGVSMMLHIEGDENKLMEGYSKNWRHNFRRSLKHDLTIRQWTRPSIDEMFSIYSEMESLKNIGQQYSREELAGILEHFGNKIILYRCDTTDGELLGFRGCAIIGTKGIDLFAAVSAKGRKMYASYALFAALINHCVNRKVKHYDMGGIDPLKNAGVYNFKKGTGALPVEYIGEWDWASTGWLGWLVNFAILLKMRQR